MSGTEGNSTGLDQNKTAEEQTAEHTAEQGETSILDKAKEMISEHLPNDAATKIAATVEKIQDAAANAADKWNGLSSKNKKLIGAGVFGIIAIGAIGVAVLKRQQAKKSSEEEGKAAAWFYIFLQSLRALFLLYKI